jgi:hypothetical protein
LVRLVKLREGSGSYSCIRMTGTETLLARSILGVFAGGLGLWAVFVQRFREGSSQSFDRLASLALAISRLGLYGLAFLVLRLRARGDIPAFYITEGLAVLRGALPYRDFPSSYAPLHPYLDGSLLYFWRSPLAIILFAILVELAAFPLWLRLGRRMASEQAVRTAAILYLFSPISLQYVAIDGQDNVLIAGFLALGIWALYRERTALSGVAVALGIVLVKFLPLLYVPAFVLVTKRRLRWFGAFTLALLAGYGGFAWLHLPLLAPLVAEGNMKSAGNLPYLVELVFGVSMPGMVEDTAVLLVLAGVIGLVVRGVIRAPQRLQLGTLTFALTAETLAVVLLAKKSWPAYLMLLLFPVCLSMGVGPMRRFRLAVFQVFSVVAVVEHSVWSSMLAQPTALVSHAALRAGSAMTLAFLLLQVGLVAGYVWLFSESIFLLGRGRAEIAGV